MSKLKSELKSQNIKKIETFHLKIKIGNMEWKTDSFRLVSSCTQLPDTVRGMVRPSRKDKKSEDDSQ